MSAKLSRRYGRACYSPPITELPPEERFLLNQVTLDRHTEFEDLPPRYQQLILAAEADLERYRQAVERGEVAEGAADREAVAPLPAGGR